MKLQKVTWILLIIAIVFGGGVYIHEMQVKPQQEDLKSQEKQLFNFKEEEIKSLTIETQKTTLKFERNQKDKQPWQMKQPKDQVANDAVISFLTNLLTSEKADRNFTVPVGQKKDYGLDNPLATIKIELTNNQKHQLILGNPGFEGELLYAQVDPASQAKSEIKVSLVPQTFQYALERKPEEWIQLEKAKPSKSEKPD